MKKILSTLVCAACLATVASADFARVEVGAGMWMQTPSGDITYVDGGATASDVSDEKSKDQFYLWALVKHPIPIVPNLRLEYAGIESTGAATGTFKNFTASGGDTSFKVTEYDIIPYYNLLDNTFWVTVDVGIDVKIMEIDYTAEGVSIPGVASTSYSDSITVPLPLLYLRARTEIPMTDIGLEADVKYISYDSNTVYDARVKVDYTLDFIPIIQPAIEVGYRVQKIETDDGEDAKINMDFAGVYAGLMLRF